VEYEANPIEPHLERGTPIYSTIQCVGQYGKNLPARLRALVKTSVQSDRALRKLEAELIKDPIYGALIGTTQAIDLVQGGVKANALPEEAWALVNHRIATQRSVFCIDTRGLAVFIQTIHPWLTSSSVVAVQQRDKDVLKHLAKEFNLTYTAFGSAISTEDGPTAGTLTLTDAWGTALEPAPVTPFDENSAPWQLLGGTIKATFNAHRGLSGEDNIFVSPGIMTGNTGGCISSVSVKAEVDYIGRSTDTRYYWNLTRHIVRYNHQDGENGHSLPNGIHTVNERMFRSLFRVWTAGANESGRHTG
jgi:Gly-Xaa carboxypeptidase